MPAAKSIEFFENLAQYYYDHKYYDLHNDYACEKIFFADEKLIIQFVSLVGGVELFLKFTNVEIVTFDFFSKKDMDKLTLDNLYRGRIELNNKLIGITEDGKAFFYLEFYEGQKVEFWAMSIDLEQGYFRT